MNYSFFNHSDDTDNIINDAYVVMHYLRRYLVYIPANKIAHHRLAILTLLTHEGAMNSSEIAKRLSLSKPQMTNFIDGLVKEKAVERQIDSSDRRKILINITDSGKTMLNGYYDLVRNYFTENLAKMDSNQIKTLSESLAQLASLVKETE
ncbi:MAG: MarR family transcriptional regulator [Dehalococcoidales bacterium]